MTELKRRVFLQRLATVSVLTALPPTVLAQIISRPPPVSPHGADTTVEQVTQGLDLSGKTFAITGASSGLGYYPQQQGPSSGPGKLYSVR